MKEQFIDKRFNSASLKRIDQINSILAEYEAEGYRLTLRQLYYQLVARGLIENTVKSYQRIGNLVSEARLAGFIDWEMIEDRGRVTRFQNHWNNPAEIVRDAADAFLIDKWADQENYAEVMVEKDALSGVLLPICRRLDVGFTANRGYSSSSALYETGKRIAEKVNEGKTVFIFYFGDHDPSGVDMTRDILDRLTLFSGTDIEVKRLALNLDQIHKLNPPRNPAKETDSRAAAYIAQFGRDSWELDAVEPRELDRLITRAIHSIRDEELWEQARIKEEKMRKELERFSNEYGKRRKKK